MYRIKLQELPIENFMKQRQNISCLVFKINNIFRYQRYIDYGIYLQARHMFITEVVQYIHLYEAYFRRTTSILTVEE